MLQRTLDHYVLSSLRVLIFHLSPLVVPLPASQQLVDLLQHSMTMLGSSLTLVISYRSVHYRCLHWQLCCRFPYSFLRVRRSLAFLRVSLMLTSSRWSIPTYWCLTRTALSMLSGNDPLLTLRLITCQGVWHRFDCQLRSVMTTMKTLMLNRMRTLLPFCLGPHNERKVVPWAKRGGRQPYAVYIYMYIYACMYDSNSIDTNITKSLHTEYL